jgi:glycosyltransferase involved in cell wall biosynthesis
MHFYLFVLLLLSFSLEAKEKICLHMIVKNEKDVIQRCLNSVMPVVDSWVIVDTGSTDGTQQIIQDHLKDIPGELCEIPWKNWGATRTEALQLAQEKGEGDYLLLMDADDVLEFSGAAELPSLEADLYYLWRGTKDFSYRRPQLIRKELPWKYVGVTHEYLALDSSFTSETLDTVKYVTMGGGAEAKDPKAKFWKNVALLEEGLKEEPNNDRYMFYLAESYRDAGEKGKALECYQKRIQMGGWAEETFWSMFQSALILKDLKLPSPVAIEALLAAHRFRPHRCEPLYYLVQLYMDQGDYAKAYEYLKARAFISQPTVKDSLFNMSWMENYGFLFQLSICAYYVGHYEESLQTSMQLLAMGDLPESWRKQTAANLTFSIEKIQELKKEVP